eukprot:6179015-Pleurochrysis_carterae.AAC.1
MNMSRILKISWKGFLTLRRSEGIEECLRASAQHNTYQRVPLKAVARMLMRLPLPPILFLFVLCAFLSRPYCSCSSFACMRVCVHTCARAREFVCVGVCGRLCVRVRAPSCVRARTRVCACVRERDKRREEDGSEEETEGESERQGAQERGRVQGTIKAERERLSTGGIERRSKNAGGGEVPSDSDHSLQSASLRRLRQNEARDSHGWKSTQIEVPHAVHGTPPAKAGDSG